MRTLITILLLFSALSLSAQLQTEFTSLPQALGKHPQGQQIVEEAIKRLSSMQLQYKFLDKTYKNDVYAKEPITGQKVRVSCVRLKGESGFGFRIDPPQFKLSTEGLVITQRFPRIAAQGLKVKFQLGPCVEHTVGIGVVLSDVTFTLRARPMIAISSDACRVTLNQDQEDFRVAIGGMNITGLQNDLDPLAKEAFEESLNALLNGTYELFVTDAMQRASVQLCAK